MVCLVPGWCQEKHTRLLCGWLMRASIPSTRNWATLFTGNAGHSMQIFVATIDCCISMSANSLIRNGGCNRNVYKIIVVFVLLLLSSPLAAVRPPQVDKGRHLNPAVQESLPSLGKHSQNNQLRFVPTQLICRHISLPALLLPPFSFNSTKQIPQTSSAPNSDKSNRPDADKAHLQAIYDFGGSHKSTFDKVAGRLLTGGCARSIPVQVLDSCLVSQRPIHVTKTHVQVIFGR